MEARTIAGSVLAVFVLLGTILANPAAGRGSGGIDLAEAAVEAGQAEEALRLLEGIESEDRSIVARALLVRSTAHFMLGRIDLGRRDLEESLAQDPGLRQAWLNRAALDISDGDLDRALEALQRARKLDPTAPDTDLNIGAVLLMQGKADDARPHLERYLAAAGDSAEAWYLVASNYALGGQAAPAVAHLQNAIALDERIRLRARTDPNFSHLAADPAFQRVLSVDVHRIQAGSHAIYRTYDSPYLAGDGKLLPAVLDALQLSGEPFDRQIEVTPDWALIWGEMRIKVRNDGHETGRVELTAPRDRFSEAEWRSRAKDLFAEIAVQLAKR